MSLTQDLESNPLEGLSVILNLFKNSFLKGHNTIQCFG